MNNFTKHTILLAATSLTITMKAYFADNNSTDFCSNYTSYGGDQTNAYKAICENVSAELAQITALDSFFDA